MVRGKRKRALEKNNLLSVILILSELLGEGDAHIWPGSAHISYSNCENSSASDPSSDDSNL